MKKIQLNSIIPAALVLVAVLGLYCLLGGCSGTTADTKTPPASEETNLIPVKTEAITQKSISLPIHAGGMLGSSAEQRLSFKIGGVIRQIMVEEGDVVRAGQLLAILDKTEIDAQVNQAQQALLKSERDLARVEGLYRDSSATLELLQNAGTGRDIAKETARIATFNQQYAEIRATKPGKIIKKLMNPGEITGPGMPVFVLFETGINDWVVNINVSDRDWARLNIGMPASIQMDAYPDITFTGKVSDLAPAADPASGLYPIEIKIQPQGKRFAPGLFAQVDITPPQARNYTLVPVEAIIEGDGKSAFVFSIDKDGQSVRKIPVQVAFLDGRFVVLSNAPADLMEVITSGAPYLNEKSKVKKI
jgi:multidrug efflux system membrane fusion protein